MIRGSKHKPESIAKQREAHRRNPTGFKLGHKHSAKTIERIRLAITGKKYGKRSDQWRKNISKGKKGVKFSEEHIKNLSLSHKGQISFWRGKKRGSMPEWWKEKIRTSNIGAHTDFTNFRRGPQNNMWKGGVTPINERIRKSIEYKFWRKSVLERDNYTCVLCEIKSEKGKFVLLHADHIKPFANHIQLRFDINNGRTLCIPCHKKTETYAGKNIKRPNYGKNNSIYRS